MILSFTFTFRTINADEGTHLMISLFIKDLSQYILNNGVSGAYKFGTNYLVYYPKITIYYPPLYHFIVSLFFNIIVSEYVAKLVTLLFALGTIFFTYKVGEEIFDRKIGFVSAAILALSPVMFILGTSVLVDMSAFFFFMLTLFFYIKSFKSGKRIHFILSGISLAFGILTKWQVVPIVAILILYLIIERKKIKIKILKNFILSLIIAGLILCPYFFVIYKLDIINLVLSGPISAGYREKDPQFTSIEGWLWYPSALLNQLTPIIAIPALLLLILFIIKRERNWKLILLWFLLFYIIFTIIPNKDERFIIPYLPAVIFPLAFRLEKNQKKNFIILLIVIIGLECLYALYYLPLYHYPVKEIAEYVYENKIGNVAFVSEGKIYSSAFMFHIAQLDKERTIQVFRPCAFYYKNETQIQQFLKENNIYYLVLTDDQNELEDFSRFKNVTLVKEFEHAKLYSFNLYDGKSDKKCNHICLTEEEICYNNI